MTSTNETDDTLTTITKTTSATKTVPMPQSKSVFGFSKTASSMHFGHAAGRLGLQGSVSESKDVNFEIFLFLFFFSLKGGLNHFHVEHHLKENKRLPHSV
jgi:hypothetical protein